MKLTSGFNFENYEITEYLGFCSGECVLGTGFFSSLDASISDLFGINSTSYSSKLKQAREAATNMLIQNAAALGADGIIGLDIDYTTFSSDIMGVIANGTAVTIKSTLKEPAVPVKINVINYNPDLEFRVSSLTILPDTEKSTITATLFGKSSENITGLLADIFLVDIFDELHPVHYTGFSHFDVAQNFATSISTPVPCSLELNILPLIKCAKVVIKKYISDNTVITASDNNSLLDIEQEDILENSNDNIFSNYKLQLEEYMESVCCMNSATEILTYTKNLFEENHDFIQADLVQLISSCASLERMYGNCKNDCIEKIKTYFDSI